MKLVCGRMLPSASRLKQRSLFGRVYTKGRSYATDLVVVYVLPNRLDVTRVGFSVSKKLGKAVARNRVKRLLREATRELLPHIRAGYDIIVVARRRAQNAKLDELRDALSNLFRRFGVLADQD